MAVKILQCSCKHAYQDSVYGKGMRVANDAVKAWVCTVCGNKHPKRD